MHFLVINVKLTENSDLYIIYNYVWSGTAIEDLTTITSNELLDVEDEISTPVTTTMNNGNTDTNPVRESSPFINTQVNGVIISLPPDYLLYLPVLFCLAI